MDAAPLPGCSQGSGCCIREQACDTEGKPSGLSACVQPSCWRDLLPSKRSTPGGRCTAFGWKPTQVHSFCPPPTIGVIHAHAARVAAQQSIDVCNRMQQRRRRCHRPGMRARQDLCPHRQKTWCCDDHTCALDKYALQSSRATVRAACSSTSPPTCTGRHVPDTGKPHDLRGHVCPTEQAPANLVTCIVQTPTPHRRHGTAPLDRCGHTCACGSSGHNGGQQGGGQNAAVGCRIASASLLQRTALCCARIRGCRPAWPPLHLRTEPASSPSRKAFARGHFGTERRGCTACHAVHVPAVAPAGSCRRCYRGCRLPAEEHCRAGAAAALIMYRPLPPPYCRCEMAQQGSKQPAPAALAMQHLARAGAATGSHALRSVLGRQLLQVRPWGLRCCARVGCGPVHL